MSINKKIILATLCVAFLLSLPFWAITYKIKFINGEDVITTADLKYYQELETLPHPSKKHHTFDGWYHKEEKIDSLDRVIGNKDLEAKFIPNSYKITYDLDGAQSIDLPTSYSYGDHFVLPELTKEHYNFIGYQVGDNIVKGIKSTDYGTKRFKAVFEPKEYKLTYELNGGKTSAKMPESYLYGSPVKMPNPVREGYSFVGWYLDESLSEKFVFNEETSGDTLLYAAYKKTPTGSGTLNTNRSLNKPYIVCGNYAASLVGDSGAGDMSEVNAIINGPGAWHAYFGNSEYIADHNYQGASAFTYNNTCAIVRDDGTTDYYVKTNSTSVFWQPELDLEPVVVSLGGSLVTQTCVGDYVHFYSWAKQ